MIFPRQVIEQNLRAQENILTALTEVNAKYASTRRVVADLIAAREAQIEALTGSFNAYEDLLIKANVKNGLFLNEINNSALSRRPKVSSSMTSS